MCTALFFALASSLAAPPKPRLAVVDVASPPSMMGLSVQVTQMLLEGARKQGYPVTPPEQVRARLGEKGYSELAACDGAAGCVAQKLSGFGVDRAVLGSLGKDEKSYQVRLWLVDLQQPELLSEVSRSILIASRRLLPDVGAAVPGLLRGEKEAVGTLKLTANVKGARVTVDGEPMGQTPLSLVLKPGTHELRLEKKAYMPIERFVSVEPNRVAEVEVRLLVRPGEVPEEEAAAALPPLVAARESPRGGFRLPREAYVAGGAALLALAGGSYFGVSSSSRQRRLRDGYDALTGVYQGTRREALLARQEAGFANISFAVAGAALATGALLTLLDARSEGTKVAPMAGAGGAGVQVGGRF